MQGFYFHAGVTELSGLYIYKVHSFTLNGKYLNTNTTLGKDTNSNTNTEINFLFFFQWFVRVAQPKHRLTKQQNKTISTLNHKG